MEPSHADRGLTQPNPAVEGSTPMPVIKRGAAGVRRSHLSFYRLAILWGQVLCLAHVLLRPACA